VQKIGKFSSFANGHHFLSKETKKRLKRKLFFLFIHWRFKTFCGNIAFQRQLCMHGSVCVKQTFLLSAARTVILLCKYRKRFHPTRHLLRSHPVVQETAITGTHGKNSRAYVVASNAAQRREELQFQRHRQKSATKNPYLGAGGRDSIFVVMRRDRWVVSCCRRRFGG
jgi:hypothetical protein